MQDQYQSFADHGAIVTQLLHRVENPDVRVTVISRAFKYRENLVLSDALRSAISAKYPPRPYETTIPVVVSHYGGSWLLQLAYVLFNSQAHLPAMLQDGVAGCLSLDSPDPVKAGIGYMFNYWDSRKIKIVLILRWFEDFFVVNCRDRGLQNSPSNVLEQCLKFSPLLDIFIFVRQEYLPRLTSWPIVTEVLEGVTWRDYGG